MASYFEKPNYEDDGAFITIRFNDILPENHPAVLIKKFIDNIDTSIFENKYKVGKNQKGRAPKDVKMMLGIILYALHSRIYSAHKIEYATENYSDFWVFTHKQKISHDKISNFLILHKEEIFIIFLETILLAHRNKLLSFECLYIDGFLIKANASKNKSYNKKKLMENESKIAKALGELLLKLENDEDEEIIKQKKEVQNKLEKISGLKEELNRRIKKRGEKDSSGVYKRREEKTTINLTDKDSELSKMKNDYYSNSYTKVCALDPKRDIIISSNIEGHNNESSKLIPLLKKANINCEKVGYYNKIAADSNFNTVSNCSDLEKDQIEFIAPTKTYEYRLRNKEKHKNKPSFMYNEQKDVFVCSEGIELKKSKIFNDKKMKVIYITYANKKGCIDCQKLNDCTKSKFKHKKIKVDNRFLSQEKVLKRYLSDEGKKIYKKRQHVAEVFQGDLKQNGRFIQLLRRGIDKVSFDSILHDISWNLRKIFNASGDKIIFQT